MIIPPFSGYHNFAFRNPCTHISFRHFSFDFDKFIKRCLMDFPLVFALTRLLVVTWSFGFSLFGVFEGCLVLR